MLVFTGQADRVGIGTMVWPPEGPVHLQPDVSAGLSARAGKANETLHAVISGGFWRISSPSERKRSHGEQGGDGFALMQVVLKFNDSLDLVTFAGYVSLFHGVVTSNISI